MSSWPEIDEGVEALERSMLRNGSRSRRIHSATFWKAFGYSRRTQSRVDRVVLGLANRGIVVSVDDGTQLGSERSNDWVELRFDDPHRPFHRPDDKWFDLMQSRQFWSEREVEFRFALPLLYQLGFPDETIALGHRMTVYRGSKASTITADLVVFAESERTRGLLIVETKAPHFRLSQKEFGQAASYAMWLPSPYYVVTNSDEIHVFQNLGPGIRDRHLLHLERESLESSWDELFRQLNCRKVLEAKEQLEKSIEVLRSQ